MKAYCAILLSLLAALLIAQITVTGGDFPTTGGSKVAPGSFGTPEFFISFAPGKNGKMIVGGRMRRGGSMVSISGNLLTNNKILAKLLDRPQTPIDGRYNPDNDSVIITRIGTKTVNEALPRFDTVGVRTDREIKPGVYRGRSEDPDATWEVNVTRSSGPSFNVIGTVTIDGKPSPIKGTLFASGKIGGLMEGSYDFEKHELFLKIFGSADKPLVATLKIGPLPQVHLFGLVEKQVGNVPGPAEANDFKISGSISENSFEVEIEMKPPYKGQAKMTHHYTGNMGATLKPGQIVELTCMSECEKSGVDAPNLGGNGTWYVEGDGAQILETSKTYVGTASDGKFYPSAQAKTVFRVLTSGTIKITAAYGGQYWGGGGTYNWNPCTYTYKFREAPRETIGGGN